MCLTAFLPNLENLYISHRYTTGMHNIVSYFCRPVRKNHQSMPSHALKSNLNVRLWRKDKSLESCMTCAWLYQYFAFTKFSNQTESRVP